MVQSIKIFLSVNLIAALVLGVSAQYPDCPKHCPKIFKPVCGTDGETYPNECVLKYVACKSESNLVVAHDGKCETVGNCNKVCPKIYAPLCASDGKTYNNQCLMNVAACESGENLVVVKQGPCKKVANKDCLKPCTREYNPVCGTDGKTYPTKCVMEVEACFSGNDGLAVAHPGACENVADCPKHCTREYKPVCGTDGKTYPNECVLKVAACKSGNDGLVVAHTGKCEDVKNCNKVCPKIYTPVCASDGKTYNNKCLMNVAACESGENLVVVKQGPCEEITNVTDCPKRCTREYKPVCGTDGKTYPNECVLKVAACKSGNDGLVVAHTGKCKDVKNCNKVCPKIYAPVCASDGKTYNNACLMNVAACESGQNLVVVKQGPCEEASDSNVMCPMIYAPVCGSDGNTYSNECMLNAASHRLGNGIVVAHTGKCEEVGTSDCPKHCTREYNPVCGSDGKTYPNECVLKMASCKTGNDGLIVAHTGKCEAVANCNKICPMIYAPVCGSDGKTYSSECIMHAEACESGQNLVVVNQGPCKEVSGCPKVCPAIYAPVCGSDGNTYSNKCMLNAAACKSGNGLVLAHDGKCEALEACPW